jgi:hypothetical protein
LPVYCLSFNLRLLIITPLLSSNFLRNHDIMNMDFLQKLEHPGSIKMTSLVTLHAIVFVDIF